MPGKLCTQQAVNGSVNLPYSFINKLFVTPSACKNSNSFSLSVHHIPTHINISLYIVCSLEEWSLTKSFSNGKLRMHTHMHDPTVGSDYVDPWEMMYEGGGGMKDVCPTSGDGSEGLQLL